MNSEESYFDLIMEGLRTRHGVDFSLYREGTIRRRLARRMVATNSEDYRTYFYVLENDPEEYWRLLRTLTIKVSSFFRNGSLFRILSDKIFPDVMKRKDDQRDDTLRIWSAGCAFGEETYSVAITLVEYMYRHGKRLDDYHISIFGTDIDEDALERAALGVYGIESIKEVKKELLNKYFIPLVVRKVRPYRGVTHDILNYKVVESIRNLVDFSKHDLTSETKKSPPVGVVANYDIILCRNLLIYFSETLQGKAFLNLFNSLNPGGYLILGKSESIPKDLEALLVPQVPGHRVYKKRIDSPLTIS